MCRSCSSPPTGRPGSAAPTPTRPPSRRGCSVARSACRRTSPPPSPAAARWSGGRSSPGAHSPPVRPAPRRAGSGLTDPGRCTSTCSSRSRSCRGSATDGAATSTARRTATPGCRRATRHSRSRPRSAATCGPWWSPATTPVRPRAVLAEEAGWPLLAEPTSGARTGDSVIRCYRLLLSDQDLTRRIQQVVVFGHPTLSRPVGRLLARDDIELYAVRGPSGLERPGPPRPLRGRPAGRWSRLARAAGRASPTPGSRSGAPATPTSRAGSTCCWPQQRVLTPHHVAGAVSAAVPEGGLLFVGLVQPGPRPRPDGGAVRRRRAPHGRRQPRARRHRRCRLQCHRDGASAARTAAGRSRCSAT